MRIMSGQVTPLKSLGTLFDKQREQNTRSTFVQAMQQTGTHAYSTLHGILMIGLAANGTQRRPGQRADLRKEAVHFTAGPKQTSLISAFLQSPEAQRVQHLTIGTSQSYAKSANTMDFDLSTVLSLFKGRQLAALRSLSLGDMFVETNGAPRGCTLGDLTPVFQAAPSLAILDLNGPFYLSKPIQHQNLQEITLHLDRSVSTEGVVSQQSFHNLLSSQLPRLHTFSFTTDHSFPLAERYELPADFTPQHNMPKLAEFTVEPLTPASLKRQQALQSSLALSSG